jgi:hypothetical protein
LLVYIQDFILDVNVRQGNVTTVCDFNLAGFTQAGYGKHVAILEQEFRAFREEDDYTGDEKQKIVLKSLLLLAYCMKLGARLRTKQPKTGTVPAATRPD